MNNRCEVQSYPPELIEYVATHSVIPLLHFTLKVRENVIGPEVMLLGDEDLKPLRTWLIQAITSHTMGLACQFVECEGGEGKLAGYVLHTPFNEKQVSIDHIYVAKRWRDTWVLPTLLDHIEQDYKKVIIADETLGPILERRGYKKYLKNPAIYGKHLGKGRRIPIITLPMDLVENVIRRAIEIN